MVAPTLTATTTVAPNRLVGVDAPRYRSSRGAVGALFVIVVLELVGGVPSGVCAHGGFHVAVEVIVNVVELVLACVSPACLSPARVIGGGELVEIIVAVGVGAGVVGSAAPGHASDVAVVTEFMEQICRQGVVQVVIQTPYWFSSTP